MKRRIWPAVASVFLLFSVSGCSLLLVQGPPPQPLWDRVGWARCTQSKAMPVVDTIMAVGSAIALVAPLLSPGDDPVADEGGPSPFGGGVDAAQTVTNALVLLGGGLSAHYGFKLTRQCQTFWQYQIQRRGRPELGERARQPVPASAQPPARHAPPVAPAPVAPAPDAPPANSDVLEPPSPANAPPSVPDRPAPPSG
jgi:hypothetical protein